MKRKGKSKKYSLDGCVEKRGENLFNVYKNQWMVCRTRIGSQGGEVGNSALPLGRCEWEVNQAEGKLHKNDEGFRDFEAFLVNEIYPSGSSVGQNGKTLIFSKKSPLPFPKKRRQSDVGGVKPCLTFLVRYDNI